LTFDRPIIFAQNLARNSLFIGFISAFIEFTVATDRVNQDTDLNQLFVDKRIQYSNKKYAERVSIKMNRNEIVEECFDRFYFDQSVRNHLLEMNFGDGDEEKFKKHCEALSIWLLISIKLPLTANNPNNPLSKLNLSSHLIIIMNDYKYEDEDSRITLGELFTFFEQVLEMHDDILEEWKRRLTPMLGIIRYLLQYSALF